MLRYSAVAGIALCCLALSALASEDNSSGKDNENDVALSKRKGKIFPVFQVIRFPNSGCVSTDASKNGTCYTADECTKLGGVSSGTCANSYGICCIFSIRCGASSSQNCTYFESSGTESGACSVEICKCSNNICQLRLDFNQFVISGPSTSTVAIGTTLNGVPTVMSAGKAVTPATQCLTDTFSVTSDNQSPPVICGDNDGEHMYVDASDGCTDLAFQLGSVGIGTALASRKWSIKVTQYACNYENLAPSGCTQYFFGSATGTVQTYNFQGGEHLANQDQNICVRTERGNCRICWTSSGDADFQVSSVNSVTANPTVCCQYGSSGTATVGSDCVTIPGALRTTQLKPGLERICGSMGGLAGQTKSATSVTQINEQTVCSIVSPFSIRFLSDGTEFVPAAQQMQNGFKLIYSQTSTNC